MLRLFKRISSVAAALATVASVAAAQQGGTISGRVLTESGAPLTAASVSISSLGLGAYTNDQGVYTINVSAARMTGQAVELTARRVGYAPKTVRVTLTSGRNIQQDFSLTANATSLTGVVVSALGVEKQKSQLGTAIQQVSSEALNATHDQNIVNQLKARFPALRSLARARRVARPRSRSAVPIRSPATTIRCSSSTARRFPTAVAAAARTAVDWAVATSISEVSSTTSIRTTLRR